MQSISVSFVSEGENFLSRHPCGLPVFARFSQGLERGTPFGSFLVCFGNDASDLFAVSGDDDGFTALDVSEQFGESGFGFCGLNLEHGLGF